jgi:thiol-disulfide isomerase/thioredoxin
MSDTWSYVVANIAQDQYFPPKGCLMIRKFASMLCLGLVAAATQAADGIDTTAFFAASLTGLDGQPVAMERFRGRPLIVNFWARWCGPCRDEIPELVKLRTEQGVDGIEVLGIAIEEADKLGAVRDFAHAYDMSYPVVLAAKDGIPLMKALGNPQAGLPFTVYIGRDGNALGSKMGVVRRADLEASAQILLK